MLVSHLHLCYLVLRRSRLLLFLPSFKFHLPERWSVVTFLSMPNFARHYLFLSSSFCSVRMILLGDWSADLKWTQVLWVMTYSGGGYVRKKWLTEEERNIWFNCPTTKTTWLTGQWSWTTQMRLCLIRIHRHFPQLPLHDRSSGFWKS